jgi:hypothetical protein
MATTQHTKMADTKELVKGKIHIFIEIISGVVGMQHK